MSTEGFSDFIRAIEHSADLRRKVKQCKSNYELIELAKSYRFSVALKDLDEDTVVEKINRWFTISKIPPI